MTSITTLAAEFDMQPYEVAAALDLGTDYVSDDELDEATAAEYHEILTVLAEVAISE